MAKGKPHNVKEPLEQKQLKLIATDAPHLALSRRMAVKAMLAMGAAPGISLSAEVETASPLPGVSLRRHGAAPKGTPTDPHLRQGLVPWQRTLDDEALQTLAALCDLILPEDERSPSASALGCHDFIDEWVSAPYPNQQRDRAILLDGLDWLAEESESRFQQNTFTSLTENQQKAICDDICSPTNNDSRFVKPAQFFTLVSNLTAGAFWTTDSGMQDLQYIGNTPLPRWDPPPKEVLQHLGLLD